jgi:hypothetical protein
MTNARTSAPGANHSFLERHGWILIIWVMAVGFSWINIGKSLLNGEMFGNDDYMRLVQVRDWIGGQGWFDLHQYRLNPADPLFSHWARLSDVLIGVPIKLLSPLIGQPNAEMVVLAVYPSALLLLAFYLIFKIARRIDDNVVKAFPIAVMTISSIALLMPFNITRIDHHGLQMVIAMAACLCILKSETSPKAMIGAGLLCGVGLYVGIESAPFIAAASAACGLIWVFDEPSANKRIRYFGAALAASTAFCILIGTAPSRWTVPSCDAVSIVYLALTGLVGGAFWLLSFTSRLVTSKSIRFGLIAGLGISALLLTIALFPNCLKGPYADVDPVLTELWLKNVNEAGPFHVYLFDNPVTGIAIVSVPMLALIGHWIYHRQTGNGLTLVARTITVFMLACFAVSLVQLRAMAITACFAIPFAAYLLSAGFIWANKYKLKVLRVLVKTSFVMLLCPLSIGILLGLPFAAPPVNAAAEVADDDDIQGCAHPNTLRNLNKLPVGTVLTQIDLGAPILKHTELSVTSAPYHRNTVGITYALDMFVGDQEKALTAIRDSKADYVIACKANSETDGQIKYSPNGMLAKMIDGYVPEGLERLDIGQGDSLMIFRVLTE